MFDKKDTHISTFYPYCGGHLGFRHFEALVIISRLGIQQIWIQHPSKTPKTLVCQKFAQNASMTLNMLMGELHVMCDQVIEYHMGHVLITPLHGELHVMCDQVIEYHMGHVLITPWHGELHVMYDQVIEYYMGHVLIIPWHGELHVMCDQVIDYHMGHVLIIPWHRELHVMCDQVIEYHMGHVLVTPWHGELHVMCDQVIDYHMGHVLITPWHGELHVMCDKVIEYHMGACPRYSMAWGAPCNVWSCHWLTHQSPSDPHPEGRIWRPNVGLNATSWARRLWTWYKIKVFSVIHHRNVRVLLCLRYMYGIR